MRKISNTKNLWIHYPKSQCPPKNSHLLFQTSPSPIQYRSHDGYSPESCGYSNTIMDIFSSLAYFSSLGKTILSFLRASISVLKNLGSFRYIYFFKRKKKLKLGLQLCGFLQFSTMSYGNIESSNFLNVINFLKNKVRFSK